MNEYLWYYKRQYNFYYFLSFLKDDKDWKLFLDILNNYLDVSDELENIKKEIRILLTNGVCKENILLFIRKISENVLKMSFLCHPILVKMIHHLSVHFFSLETPYFIKNLKTYSHIIEELQTMEYPEQLFCFLQFIKELRQQCNRNVYLDTIISATQVCLHEIKNSNLKNSIDNYIEYITPVILELKNNDPTNYAEIQHFFALYPE